MMLVLLQMERVKKMKTLLGRSEGSMFGPRKPLSVLHSLNSEAVPIASERKNVDEMKKEQYFLLKSFNCPEAKTRIDNKKKVEEMLQAEWDQSIKVKGFVEQVAYTDFGLEREDQQLSSLRLYSDIPCVFERPLKNFKNGSFLVTISEALKSYCCCGVPLYQLKAILDIVPLIKMYQEDTGVTLGIDEASDFWLYGMWFQVAVTRRFINSEYDSNVSIWNTVEDNNPETKGMQRHLEKLLNDCTLSINSTHKVKKITKENSSQWFDVGLFSVTFLSYRMKCKGGDYLELHLLTDVDIHKVQLVVSSHSKNACQKYCNDFTSHYKDNQGKFCTVSLPSTYPRSYRDMLKKTIQAAFFPYLTVTMNKGRTVDFVFMKQGRSEVEEFIRTYVECNAPKKTSHIEDLLRIAKPLDSIAWPWTDSVKDATSCPRHNFRRADEKDKICIGLLAKPEMHVEYLQKVCKTDLYKICMDNEAELQFEKGQILVEVDDRSKLVNCLWRLEKLYNRLCIQTREMLSQCLPEDQKGLFVKPINSTVVSVTGSSSTLSIIAETLEVGASVKLASLEKISLNSAGSTCQEHMHQRSDQILYSEKSTSASRRGGKKRDRQLLDPQMHFTQEEEKIDVIENIHGRNDMTGAVEYSYTKTAGTEAYQHFMSGSYVEVGCGDINKLEVDAIVNAANQQLRHLGGVALETVVAGGESIQTESMGIEQRRQLQIGDACITGAGKLPCKMVIHAFAPAYERYKNKQDCLTDLKQTFMSCFKLASENGFVSLAMPPLGAGMYAIPAEDVAETACVTLQDFLKKNPDTSLRFIRFVDIQDQVLAICRDKLDIMVRANSFAKM